MTDDKGDEVAVADLVMTDDCRVGHVSTVLEKTFRMGVQAGQRLILSLLRALQDSHSFVSFSPIPTHLQAYTSQFF